MREIKFRAWDKENKTMIIPDEKENEKNGTITLNTWCDSENSRSIIMQFTGLLDKNGKEIYEGDLIVFKDLSPKPVIIEWKDGGWYYLNIHITGGYPIEVIGNIHENKELLNTK